MLFVGLKRTVLFNTVKLMFFALKEFAYVSL